MRARDTLQVVYRSEQFSPLSRNELQGLGRQAKHDNARMGLTGVLMCYGNRFIGALEGHPKDLLSLLEAICGDRRHKNLTVLHEAMCCERRFVSWQFGLIDVTGTDEMLNRESARLAQTIARGLTRLSPPEDIRRRVSTTA